MGTLGASHPTPRRIEIDVDETGPVPHSSDDPVRVIRTFLFTDIEGSYRQWERHPEAMPRALAQHDAILQSTIEAHGGRIFKTIGDAACAAFDAPIAAVRAAVEAQRTLHATDWQAIGLERPLTVRMALQTGAAEERNDDFSGLVLNRISRLLRTGHGGQILLTGTLAEALDREPVAGARLRDLGDRRLRDVPGVTRILQLEIDGLPAAFPPLATLDTISLDLPVMLDACLGREAELHHIRWLLLDARARLVTLLGPGGIGKTRLAVQAASQMVDAFPDGIWFVDLASVRDPAVVPTAIAAVLDAPVGGAATTALRLAEAIADRQLLLLLDTCEPVGDGVSDVVASVLPVAPGVQILATSRFPLHVRGEQRVEIGPLPIEQDAGDGPAVQLFLERAQQVRPSFTLTPGNRQIVRDICQRVDGIPLALELAAARIGVLGPDALRNRLSSRLAVLKSANRDVPERHRTFHDAIDWSYALLPPDEQTAFRALSVFQGGWSLDAACAVTGLDETTTIAVLSSLRDNSLVRSVEAADGRARYAMFETIQEFGNDRLAENAEQHAVQTRFCQYFAGIVDAFGATRPGDAEHERFLRLLGPEIGNIREVLGLLIRRGDAAAALRLCLESWHFWSMRGAAAEGSQWFQAALDRAAALDPQVRARALRQMGNFAIETGDTRRARALYEQALTIADAAGDADGAAVTLALLGMVASLQCRDETAIDLLDRSIAYGRAHDDVQMIMISTVNRAITARNIGDLDGAHALLEAVMDLQQHLGDEFGLAWTHFYLAHLAIDTGNLTAAGEFLAYAQEAFDRLSDHEGSARARVMQALVLVRRGHPTTARGVLDQAIAAHQSRNDRLSLAQAQEVLAELELAATNLPEAAAAIGRAEGLRDQCGAPVPIADRPAIDRIVLTLRSAMPPSVADRAIARGRMAVGGSVRGLFSVA